MRVLVDTNVLARLAQAGHAHHAIAHAAVRRMLERDDEPCIVPQVLYEFWVIATRPVSGNGLGFSVDRAEADVANHKQVFTLLLDERAIYPEWERLVVALAVSGKPAHDARLVAAMQRHGLTHLLTFNGSDFSRYPGITVIEPAAV